MVFEPLEFFRRIASLIPPARSHSIRYHGLFAAASKDRAKACALVPPVNDEDEAVESGGEGRCNHRPSGATAVAANQTSMSIANGESADDPDRDAPYRKRRRIAFIGELRYLG